ncbi:hypothetical protein QO259_06415 [Salinicola sp. JS01]|uniref:hypothetical protein n=1 Tax=Salinicola sp. JS01 TaxID=3050071 RepID=UPI00255BC383|nr:hypothetical protein [Salinicola sp. JS01]WIX34287.1 hypothetical protein QO259_06415 [Salinicola sp. JS01]
MHSERSRLHYTCVFLLVSFQAVRQSLPAATSSATPCWLDAEMLKMLLRELKRCREEASPFPPVHASLDVATYHCGLLMAQCPAALDPSLCSYHLDAITQPLKQAIAELSGHHAATAGTTQSGRGWRGWLKR